MIRRAYYLSWYIFNSRGLELPCNFFRGPGQFYELADMMVFQKYKVFLASRPLRPENGRLLGKKFISKGFEIGLLMRGKLRAAV